MPQDPVDDEAVVEEGYDPAFAQAVRAELLPAMRGASRVPTPETATVTSMLLIIGS